MPTVSVVIPTFNRAALLPEAIASVFRQGYRDVEILVVDDGSTDNTSQVLRGYDGLVRSFRQPNKGVNAARNVAVEHAQGRYVALLDSDDVWLPYLLELLVGLLEKFPTAGFAYCDFHVWREGEPLQPRGLMSWHGAGHRWESVFEHRFVPAELGLSLPQGIPRRDVDIYAGDIYAASLAGPQVPTSASLIRRDLMGTLRFPESDSFCGDWEFFARLSRRHGAVYADIEGMLNRSHDDAVRLTRFDGALQLEHKVALIDRVWRADEDFMAGNRSRVDAKQHTLLMQLAKVQLLRGQGRQCKGSLSRAAGLDRRSRSIERRALAVAATIPGAGLALRMARDLRHRARKPGGSRAS